jgi:germination protein M
MIHIPRPRTARLRPTLLALALILAVAGAAGAAACGGTAGGATGGVTPTGAASGTTTPASPQESEAPSSSPAAATTTVRPYFLRGEKLGVAERQVPRTLAVAAAALTALCDGPATSEQAAGLSSAVPPGTRLLGVSVKDGVATVDLSGEFASGGGSLSMQARVAQVVYTVTQFDSVKSVDLRMDGEPLASLGGEGLLVDPGQTRAEWSDFEPAIFVERPGAGAVLTNPFVLSGTALVFEGAFMTRLIDDSGRRIVNVPVQASAGGPERGDFRKVIPFSTSAGAGTLIVYDQSMEDGSRQDEVRIPVSFAP